VFFIKEIMKTVFMKIIVAVVYYYSKVSAEKSLLIPFISLHQHIHTACVSSSLHD